MSTVEYAGYPGDHQLAYASPAFATGGGDVVVDAGFYPGLMLGQMSGPVTYGAGPPLPPPTAVSSPSPRTRWPKRVPAG